ncbi:hypothetical protein [Haliscomenobacter sp.]|uniref:hypothetical protein n=1 Tax=Haliscomenobacter sp. TaxID=2717303 RepID=UPI003BADABFC
MNKEFDVVEFFQGVKHVYLERNIKSSKRHELTKEYLDLYSFVKKDTVFVDFIQRINGVFFSSSTFLVALYGFGLPEDELIFSLPQYINAQGFLMLGEYVDKRIDRNWKGIVYAYNRVDQSPVVYAKFDIKDKPEIKKNYYSLCTGFQELVKIIMSKDFEEQFNMAYIPENPRDEPIV